MKVCLRAARLHLLTKPKSVSLRHYHSLPNLPAYPGIPFYFNYLAVAPRLSQASTRSSKSSVSYGCAVIFLSVSNQDEPVLESGIGVPAQTVVMMPPILVSSTRSRRVEVLKQPLFLNIGHSPIVTTAMRASPW